MMLILVKTASRQGFGNVNWLAVRWQANATINSKAACSQNAMQFSDLGTQRIVFIMLTNAGRKQ
jgi:hypothetical protein